MVRCYMARRRPLSRRSRISRTARRRKGLKAPTSKSSSPVPYILAGLGVGVGIYLLTQPSTAQAATGPGTPGTQGAITGVSIGPAVIEGGGGGGGGNSGNANTLTNISRLTSLYNRLRSDQNALQLYAFQALMYQMNLTQAVPDGIMGPTTAAMIRGLQQSDNLPVTGTFDTSLFAAAYDVTGYTTAQRQLPDTLPDDIAASLNAVIAAAYPVSGTLPPLSINTIPAAPTSTTPPSYSASYSSSGLAPVSG